MLNNNFPCRRADAYRAGMQAQIFLEVMSLSDIRTEQEGMRSTLAQIQEGQERQVLLAALEKLLTKR